MNTLAICLMMLLSVATLKTTATTTADSVLKTAIESPNMEKIKVQHLTGSNFESKLHAHTWALVKFYTPSHEKASDFQTWLRLAAKEMSPMDFSGKKLLVAQIDCSAKQNADACDREKISVDGLSVQPEFHMYKNGAFLKNMKGQISHGDIVYFVYYTMKASH